jgi:hypothetical protein
LKAGKIKDFISLDSEIGKLLYFSNFLKNLESCLVKLKKTKGLSQIIEKLRCSYDPIEFFYTVDRIEIASILLEHFDGIELETEIEQYQADFKVKHKDRSFRFSFLTPNTVEEFVKEIPLSKENTPLVPIVDISHSKTSGSKARYLYDVKEISGFVIYHKIVSYGTLIPMGFFVENPKAKDKLLRDEISILCQSLHLIRFPATELVQVFSKESVQKTLERGGFNAAQSLLQETFTKYLGDWMKKPEDVSLLFLQLMTLLRKQSDNYEYRCYALSFVLHFSALTVNAENWWRELMRLKGSFSFLQDGIAQIQNLETILLSKRRVSEEIKISLLLPLYTSTLEGIFQLMAKIIVMEINIIAGKSSKDISIIGLPKLVQEINSFNEGELRVLTTGYNQTLRNAYSHGTCNINLHDREIIAKDRKKEEVFTFTQLKKMRKRLEQASYMVALSLVTIFFRLALEQWREK